ncbi:MAG: PQQ-binding-like beta-propeller repeat protein [Prevotella sp.]|nr:PQQ-binding-like beta-propeller repeat protein [Prevotella sp.]
MKYIFFCTIIFVLPFFSCRLMTNDNNKNSDKEPSYKASIVWESNTNVISFPSDIAIADSNVYVYENTESEEVISFRLSKLNAKTGEVMWRTESFSKWPSCPPQIIGEYAYVFLFQSSLIHSYDIETGKLAAIIETDTENNGMEIESNPIVYGNYLFFGIYNGPMGSYLARLDVTTIDYSKNHSEFQFIDPEIIWVPELGGFAWTEPIIRNNVIYCRSYAGITSDDPIELAGINMDTKQVVFHQRIDYDNGQEHYPLLIHEDIIYILGHSLSAYNLNTGEQLFLKTFTGAEPDNEWYAAIFSSLGKVYHKGKIYYTNSYSDVICIDAKTGKLAWKERVPLVESLGTNPIIVNDKMYVPYAGGLRVYDTNTGKLIGVDKSFEGHGQGKNILYNNYMIAVKHDSSGIGKVVAINLGG